MNSASVRSVAAWAVDRTLASRLPAAAHLAAPAEALVARDRRLLQELVAGTLRWLRRIDQVIVDASGRSWNNIDPALRSPLRLAVYQLLFLDRIPPHAAVSEAVVEARRRTHRRGGGFVNAVLRRIASKPELEAWPVREQDPRRRLAIESSHPDLLVHRWIERFGEQTARVLLAANNRIKPQHLLSFLDRGGPEALHRSLAQEQVETEPSRLSPLGLIVRGGDPLASDAFRRGEFYLQDEASQAAALVPPPDRGDRILDVAAAPGGKSFAMLAWQGELELVCADVSLARLSTLRVNCLRLRRPVSLLACDGFTPALRGGFDRVVVDLPCSGTGTLRKHPELKWRLSEGEIRRLSRQGLQLLEAVCNLVRRRGLLVAITCSLEEEENEGVVRSLLQASRDFELFPLHEAVLPECLVAQIVGLGHWRVLTGGDHDGFTVHVLRRAA